MTHSNKSTHEVRTATATGREDLLQNVTWAAVAGYITGTITLLFFMALVFASMFQHIVPAGARFGVVVVLAFGAALSFAFIGGTAAAQGSLPIPYTHDKPVVFSVTGGIAVLIIVFLLGFHLYMPPNQTFTATVTPLDHGRPINTSGKIQLEYGDNSPIQDINSLGQAEFKLIPIQYLGQKVKVWPRIPGYQDAYQEVALVDSGIDIELQAIDTVFKGQITPFPAGKAVKVTVDGESDAAVPDQFGRFSITVHGRYEGQVRVRVYVDDIQKYDDFQQLPGPATISLRK